MRKSELLIELLRYGTFDTDFEFKDGSGMEYRVRVINYNDKKYLVVQCDGDPIAVTEVNI